MYNSARGDEKETRIRELGPLGKKQNKKIPVEPTARVRIIQFTGRIFLWVVIYPQRVGCVFLHFCFHYESSTGYCL